MDVKEIRLEEGDEGEVLRYLEYHGQKMQESLHKQVAACMEKINQAAHPKFVYKKAALPGPGVFPQEYSFFTGESIAKHIEGCHEIILFAATLGIGVDNAIRKEQLRNMSNAVIMDSCASVLVEAFCDGIDGGFRQEYEKEGAYLTFRFSPGYGDLPIGIQRQFITVVDASRRIGLHVNESGILTPRKSVTALLGVSKTKVETLKRSCQGCTMVKACRFLRRGVRCYA